MLLIRLMLVPLFVATHAYAADEQEQQLLNVSQSNVSQADIKMLFKSGARFELMEEGPERPSALHCAVISNSADNSLLLYLIEECNIDVNGRDSKGETPCHFAATCNKGAFIRTLYQKGADVNAKNEGLMTPLHLACINGRSDAVKTLLEHGADIHIKTREGKTPKDLALNQGNKDIIQLLEDHENIPDTKMPDVD